MKHDFKTRVELGKLNMEIKKLMSEGKEEEAYEVLNELNSKLSDLTGNVLEMEQVLAIGNR